MWLIHKYLLVIKGKKTGFYFRNFRFGPYFRNLFYTHCKASFSAKCQAKERSRGEPRRFTTNLCCSKFNPFFDYFRLMSINLFWDDLRLLAIIAFPDAGFSTAYDPQKKIALIAKKFVRSSKFLVFKSYLPCRKYCGKYSISKLS